MMDNNIKQSIQNIESLNININSVLKSKFKLDHETYNLILTSKVVNINMLNQHFNNVNVIISYNLDDEQLIINLQSLNITHKVDCSKLWIYTLYENTDLIFKFCNIYLKSNLIEIK